MYAKKILNYLTIACIPFGFASCTYLLRTPDPNPLIRVAFGIRRSGMNDWEKIKQYSPNKNRPDYCLYSSRKGYASLNCYKRLNEIGDRFEETIVSGISCSKDSLTSDSANKDYDCRFSERKIKDIEQYKRWMRFAGDGKPTVKEQRVMYFRSKLGLMSALSFLAFPLLLILNIFLKEEK